MPLTARPPRCSHPFTARLWVLRSWQGGPEAELAEPMSVCECWLVSDWTQLPVMCVSEAQEKKRNCVKHLGMRVLNDSADRCFICSLQAFIVCVQMQMCGDVCAHLCRHTSMNFIAVLIRSRYAWRGVGICVCVRARVCCVHMSMSSHLRCQISGAKRGNAEVNIYSKWGKFLFMKTNRGWNNAGKEFQN